MNKFAALIFAAAAAGCLGPAPKPPANWTIDVDADVKASFVTVCAPYGGQRIAVLRQNGSIAFDPCNSFAAAPASILKDALVSRGGKLSLGQRDALVELELSSGDRTAKGTASVPTPDGNYTSAFSRAFAKAFDEARKGLK